MKTRHYLIAGCMMFSAFASSLSAEGVIVEWQSNTEPSVTGYRIYYGKLSSFYQYTVDVGNATSHHIPAMPDSGVYYFSVKAYDLTNLESQYSKEIAFHVPWDESMAPPETPEIPPDIPDTGSSDTNNPGNPPAIDNPAPSQPGDPPDTDDDGTEEPAAEEALELPYLFDLLPNYPNPMNPETRIPYYLKSDALVRINVYDSFGRHVKTLKESILEAGQYEVLWDGTNASGNQVATGVYICNMQVGHYSTSQKLNLIR